MRADALKQLRDLQKPRKENVYITSASMGAVELAGETELNKIG